MLKFLSFIIGICLLVIGVIWSIQTYLSPDDLSSCAEPDPLSAKCAPADAIVAISGGDTAARTQEAIDLYEAGWAPIIVFSGAALDEDSPSNAAVMRKQALAAGVPDSAIIIEEDAMDTAQNAIKTARILTDANRIILVTSPYHQRRAYIEFKAVFGDDVTILNHPTINDRQWTSAWFLTPNGWWLALSEMVKSVVTSL